MKRKGKEDVVKDLREAFEKHDSFYLVDFIKMPVSQLTELRKKFRENSCSFKVIKNRLALRALNEDIHRDLKPFFRGSTAVAFAPQNPIGLARILREFSEQHKVMHIKAGLLEGQFLPAEKFNEISRLTSRNDLVARVGSLMASHLMKLLWTWQAPINSIGSVLSQLKTKK